MANNFPAFQTEIINLLTNTANLDPATKQKIRDRFVAAYPTDFATFLAANALTDTAANRGKFVVEKTFNGFWRDIWTAQSTRENQAAVVAPDAWT